MYVTDQESFINGVCEVETTMDPITLLDTLQSIEINLGRRKIIDKGPRSIDLDILLYNNAVFTNPRLDIPHKLMLEREFVLRPLCQLIPQESHPSSTATYQSYLDSLPPSNPAPLSITPLSTALPPLCHSNPRRSTHVMAIINRSPDSFSGVGSVSEGGLSSSNMYALTRTVQDFIRNGVTIIDVGGESTRPGAEPVTEETELSRVIPTIKHIRSLPESSQIAISIDTYRARVAEAAVEAGADIINDVSAGTMDPEMLPTMARLQKTVILMHMRGTPKTMMKKDDYSADGGVTNGVGRELVERVAAAENAGIRRWRIILDPGVGFAKDLGQNLELLRNGRALSQFRGLEYFPWLVGTSRKGFIGRITGVEDPRERVLGTAVAVTAAIEGGADIVRVHDIEEMREVTLMADAIYRGVCDA
ncbi:trifunctional dihydropteroate synthetase [Onygenales sp. PD_12]|nr:trifunctional dihydropteroate synthetase [Onygenales sp. PD_12]